MPAQGIIVKIQNKGLITIPKIYREKVGFEENGLARVKIDRGRVIIEPVRTLPYPVRSYSDKEIRDFIKLDEKESKRLKAQGLL